MFIRGHKIMIKYVCKKGKMRGTLECNGPSFISTRVFQLVRLIIFDLKKKRENPSPLFLFFFPVPPYVSKGCGHEHD